MKNSHSIVSLLISTLKILSKSICTTLRTNNYPNSFNPITTIIYGIPEQVRNDKNNVSLKVYDVIGNEVAVLVDEQKFAGEYEVKFNWTNLSGRIYYYKLSTNENSVVKRMLLLK